MMFSSKQERETFEERDCSAAVVEFRRERCAMVDPEGGGDLSKIKCETDCTGILVNFPSI